MITILVFIASSIFIISEAAADNIGDGKKIFNLHCAQCHQPGQEFMTLQTTSLRDSMMKPDSVLLETVKSGSNAMPGFYGILKDKEIINSLLYMRMIW